MLAPAGPPRPPGTPWSGPWFAWRGASRAQAVFYIGLGDQFDDEKLVAHPPGAVVVLPGGTPHFHWAKSGEYVTQVTAIGPLGLEYLDPEDDPRNA